MTPASSSPLLLGLDIGGTKIGVCVGDAAGRLLASDRIPVDHRLPPAKVLAAALDRLHHLASRAAGSRTSIRPAALGCACPGPFDHRAERFLNPPNNPGWHGFALGAFLRERFDIPLAIMNDANAAAIAEWRWGAARNADTAVFLTMSTGMGAGLIINRRLFEGPLAMAGEIGQIRLTPNDAGPVGFAKRGSVEGYCSGPGMQQLARAEALICRQSQQPSLLLDILDKHGDISVPALCDASTRRDPAARRVTDRVALELGRLCSILVDILNPNVIVLGTIGAAYPKLFIPGAMRVVRAESIPLSAKLVRIKPSPFPPDTRGDLQALAVAHQLLTTTNPPPRAPTPPRPARRRA